MHSFLALYANIRPDLLQSYTAMHLFVENQRYLISWRERERKRRETNPNSQQESNPRPLGYEASSLPRSYHHCIIRLIRCKTGRSENLSQYKCSSLIFQQKIFRNYEQEVLKDTDEYKKSFYRWGKINFNRNLSKVIEDRGCFGNSSKVFHHLNSEEKHVFESFSSPCCCHCCCCCCCWGTRELWAEA